MEYTLPVIRTVVSLNYLLLNSFGNLQRPLRTTVEDMVGEIINNG